MEDGNTRDSILRPGHDSNQRCSLNEQDLGYACTVRA